MRLFLVYYGGMDDQPVAPSEVTDKVDGESKETFQEELCRRGRESATQIVAARRAVGIEPTTLGFTEALSYLRPVNRDDLNRNLLAEIDASDQPHISVVVLDETHALVCSPSELQMPIHNVSTLDFTTGRVRTWHFAQEADNGQITHQMQQDLPDQEEQLSGSLATHGVYRQLTNALATYHNE